MSGILWYAQLSVSRKTLYKTERKKSRSYRVVNAGNENRLLFNSINAHRTVYKANEGIRSSCIFLLADLSLPFGNVAQISKSIPYPQKERRQTDN